MKIKEKIGERRRMGEMRDEEEEEEEKKEEREGGREKIEISKRQTRGRTNRWMVEKLQALKRGLGRNYGYEEGRG